jgi:predicted O-linked N-acetylglucosamine transferase (SPINDLY family)
MVDEAIAAGRRLVALNPDFADAHCNLGLALMEKGLVDEAIDAYRQAISLKPNLAEAWNNLANALKDKKQLDQAIAAYRRCIELKADFAQAYSNLGNALREKGQLPEAIATCRRAIELDPQLAEAHSNLGNALNDMGQLEVAISAFQDAMALDPNLPEAPYNLANVLTERGEVDLAVAAYRQAIALKPDYADAFNNLGNALKEQGLLNEALAAYRQGIAIDPQNATIDSNLIYTLHFLPEADARAIAQEHERWNRQHADPLRKFIVPHGNGRDPRRRLRIGYVSPDFRAHAVGRFLLPLFDHHDKSQFEIFAYANSTYSDFVTERLRSKADAWRNISELSDAAAADLVRGDGIDILVDLTMHMARSRLLIFARKPAPVQVTYLAYCSSTGMRTIDYRLSDPYLDQAGADETLYSEKTIRLPRSYWCFEPILAPPGVAPSPASAQKRVTFGCLNNFCKVSAPAVAAWVKILRSVPQAQLILGAQEGSHRQRLANELSGQGIDPARLSFVGRMPLPDYLRIYNQIDIALDTFPYGGGTTTCDALWMGVPVVSLIGKRAVGRGGLSILSNIGLAELAGGSEQEYVRIAIELANDLPRLSQLRSTLRQRMQQSPLMDAPGFARQIEAAYRQMWQTWCAAPPTG